VNKTILTGVLSLMLGLASMYLLKPAKIVPGKEMVTPGETVYLPDSAAIAEWKAKYDSVLWELEQAEQEAPPVPDTCKGVVEYWKKQVGNLKSAYSECQTALSATGATKSGKRVFIDTLDNWLVVRGIVPFPIGAITLQTDYLRKPFWRQERASIGLSLPLWDWPTIRGLVRVKDSWWVGLGVRPEISNGDWLTRYSVEVNYSFLRF